MLIKDLRSKIPTNAYFGHQRAVKLGNRGLKTFKRPSLSRLRLDHVVLSLYGVCVCCWAVTITLTQMLPLPLAFSAFLWARSINALLNWSIVSLCSLALDLKMSVKKLFRAKTAAVDPSAILEPPCIWTFWGGVVETDSQSMFHEIHQE